MLPQPPANASYRPSILAGAGHAAEATDFFERCLHSAPYAELRARCAAGFGLAAPDRAFGVMTKLLGSDYDLEVNGMALRMLGALAGAEGCPPQQKDAALGELTKRTKGIMNASLNLAVIDGLARTRDPRAVEPLQSMTKGMTRDAAEKRAALRALAIGFEDASAIQQLQKNLKGGFMSDGADKVLAGLVLIEAKHQAGFDWARDYLGKPKKKGLLSRSSDDPDCSSDVAAAAWGAGGDQAKAVLKAGIAGHKRDEWLTSYMAIALLDLGDASEAAMVKGALTTKEWPYTQTLAAMALAKSGDYSGIPVLDSVSQADSLGKQAVQLALGSWKDPEDARTAVAEALGRIDRPEGVPTLLRLLGDKSEQVRLTAAFALIHMTDASALDGLSKVLATNFGAFEGKPRTPTVHAAALQAAVTRFPRDPRTHTLVTQARTAAAPSVRFMALAMGTTASGGQ